MVVLVALPDARYSCSLFKGCNSFRLDASFFMPAIIRFCLSVGVLFLLLLLFCFLSPLLKNLSDLDLDFIQAATMAVSVCFLCNTSMSSTSLLDRRTN